MKTTTSTVNGLTLTIGYPNNVAFMYSPQLVRVTGEVPTGAKASITVKHMDSGRAHTETRAFFNGAVQFDISHVMQLLAPDVDSLFERLDGEIGQNLTEFFEFRLHYLHDGQKWEVLSREDIVAFYGALDPGETYGKPAQRRLWLNFPQTFNLWKNKAGEVFFAYGDLDIYPELNKTNGNKPCYECDFIRTLGGTAGFTPGVAKDVWLTWKTRVENGAETAEDFRHLVLIPDGSRMGDGTYLRWLNRRGEVSYWLFTNSQIRATTAVRSRFKRYYENDPHEPVGASFVNSQKADYSEVREVVLGAVGLSREEYEDLCDLATSPLVERLIPPQEEVIGVNAIIDGGGAAPQDTAYDGGEASADNDTIIDAEAQADTPATEKLLWQRVNVAAGTFARNIRRNTPSRQDLEFVIELPERNTIKL